MITISGLRKSFGARDIFRATDLTIGARDRIGLVGPNGSGKTTLLNMIAGESEPDEGRISISKGVLIGYLRQHTDRMLGRTVIEEVLSAGNEVVATGHRIQILQQEISDTSPGVDQDKLVAEYGRLQSHFEALGGYSIESRAKTILGGLGFSEQQMNEQTETFSGGWLMRIALAKLLLIGPDLLMLDEPTNHLDVESVEWLERFLSVYEGAILLISHDRDFLNGIATSIIEIDKATLFRYKGNFANFIEQRALAIEQAEALAKTQARKVKQTQEFIDRFRYKASKARQVQSRIKTLEKLGTFDAPTASTKTMRLKLPPPPRSGRRVIELRDVRFSYGDKSVYEGLDLFLERGEKIALVGPNGAGKSTLLKLIAGVLEPTSGERVLGHNVFVGYFAQHQAETLDSSKRMIEEMQASLPPGPSRPRDILGRFLFSGDDAEKKVSVLSGGEKSRLALAKMLVSPVNLLCMDEPTNHLDMPSRDVLEDALTEYDGALVLITHDRHLIRNVATKILEVVAGEVTVFPGDYASYVEERAKRAVTGSVAPPVRDNKQKKRLQAEQRARTKSVRDEILRIELHLGRVEERLAEIANMLGDPSFYSEHPDEVARLVKEYEEKQRLKGSLEESWTKKSEQLQDAGFDFSDSS